MTAEEEQVGQRQRPSRTARILDLLGLATFLAGGGLLVRAWIGYESVETFERTADDGPWAAMELADSFHGVQRQGVALMVLGLAIFVLAWWVGGREAGASSPGGEPQ